MSGPQQPWSSGEFPQRQRGGLSPAPLLLAPTAQAPSKATLCQMGRDLRSTRVDVKATQLDVKSTQVDATLLQFDWDERIGLEAHTQGMTAYLWGTRIIGVLVGLAILGFSWQLSSAGWVTQPGGGTERWRWLLSLIGGGAALAIILTMTQFWFLRTTSTIQRQQVARREQWFQELLVYVQGGPAPRVGLDRLGTQVLLHMRDSLPSGLGRKLALLYERDGILQQDLLALKRPWTIVERASAAERLGRAVHPKAFAALMDATQDADESLRQVALLSVCHALGRLNNAAQHVDFSALYVLLSSGVFTRGLVLEALILLGPFNVPPLVGALLSCPHPEVRATALDAALRLRLAGQSWTNISLGALRDPSAEVRASALRVLASRPEGITTLERSQQQQLFALLWDSTWFVRVQALKVCRLLPAFPMEVQKRLLHLADHDHHGSVRIQAQTLAAERFLYLEPSGRHWGR